MWPRLIWLMAALVSAWAALRFGASTSSWSEVWSALTGESAATMVVWNLRIPRLALGLLVGAGLAACGASMQSLFRNPLADPGLIGVSAGATIGVALLLWVNSLGLLTEQAWLMSAGGFAGAAAAAGFVWWLAGAGASSRATLILSGVAVNAAAGAALGLLSYISDDRMLRNLTMWTLGSLGGASWSHVALVTVVVGVGVWVLAAQGNRLDVLQLGDSEAELAGVDLRRLRRLVVMGVALVTGTCVALTGAIGFIGLVTPHLVRLAGCRRQNQVLWWSMACGSLLLVNADTVARTWVAPAEIPVGILTALVGTPVLGWLLRRDLGELVERLPWAGGRRGREEVEGLSVLEARDVRVCVAGRTILEVPKLVWTSGQVHVLMGPAGAGKSTLLQVLSGGRTAPVGEVRLDSRTLQEWGMAGLARRRAMVVQHAPVSLPWTGREVVSMGRLAVRNGGTLTAADHASVDSALAQAGATGLSERHWDTLSGGERQRVMLARALAQVVATEGAGSTPWLLLDEPTAALDPAWARQLMEQVRVLAHERGVGVIVVMHDLALASEVADQVLLMSSGRVVAQGGVHEVMTAQRLASVFSIRTVWRERGAGQRPALDILGVIDSFGEAVPGPGGATPSFNSGDSRWNLQPTREAAE
jgi:iron complex transport system permease protein